MIRTLFPANLAVLKKAIAVANTKEEQLVCSALLEHCQEDFKYFNIPDYSESIQELRDQLQVKHEELIRQEA